MLSNANLTANNDDGNAEIYLANFSVLQSADCARSPKTKDAVDSSGNVIATTTVFSFGHRLSRDGNFSPLRRAAARQRMQRQLRSPRLLFTM